MPWICRFPIRPATFFNLVVGGSHADVVSLFRDVEQRVVGGEATGVRDEAKRTKNEKRTGQAELTFGERAGIDARYERLHAEGLQMANATVLKTLTKGSLPYRRLWPSVLEEAHLTKGELNELIATLRKDGTIALAGWKKGQRIPHDDNILSLSEANTPIRGG